MNKEILKKAGFGEQVKAFEEKKCVFCKKEIKETEFKDDLSRKEYNISGICQSCQDKTFGG